MPTIGDGSFPTAAPGFDPKRSQPVAGPPAWRGRWARRGPTRDKEVFSRVERENRRDTNPDLPHTLAAKHQGRAGIGRCPVDRRSGADLRLFRVPGQVAHDVDDPNFERRAAAAYLELRPADLRPVPDRYPAQARRPTGRRVLPELPGAAILKRAKHAPGTAPPAADL